MKAEYADTSKTVSPIATGQKANVKMASVSCWMTTRELETYVLHVHV